MHKATVLAELLTQPEDAHRTIHYLQTGDRQTRVSYAQLLVRARALLSQFHQRGMRPGDALIVFVRDNRAFIDAFWACQLGGFIAVPLAGSVQGEALRKLQRVAELLPSPWLFSDRDLCLRFRQSTDAEALFSSRVCLLEEITGEPEPIPDFDTCPDDLALIQFSSGSTGEPKGVQLTHANLLANLRAICRAAAIGKTDSTLSWMPLSHDMGLVGFHLVPLFRGINQVLMDTERFVRRPAHWLETAQAHESTLLCSPNFGYQHYLKAVGQQKLELDLSMVRLIFNGAEPISAAVSRAFLARLADCGLPANVMYPVYGLAEASLAVTFPPPGSGLVSIEVAVHQPGVGQPVQPAGGPDDTRELVCLGRPVEHCELQVCDADGAVLDKRVVGHVRIRGDNVSRGYYRCPDCDRESFADGWLDTGDLGFMSEHGLVITGRHREVIFVDGQNRFPQDIEYVLQSTAGIEAGKVAVSALRSDDNAEDRLLVFVQFRRDLEAFAEHLPAWQAALTAATGLHAQAIVPVHSLPRTSSGKLQRYRLADSFAAGEYDASLDALAKLAAVAPPAGGTGVVERQLLDICRGLFPDHPITTEQNLFELGADSLMLVRIHEEIDSLYPGKVAVTDVFDYPTIAQLAGYIES